MRVTLFISFLCLLLLKVGGTLPVFAASAPSANQLEQGSVQPSQSRLIAWEENLHQPALDIRAGGNDEDLSLVNDDAEDEESNDLLLRKFKLITRDYSEILYQCSFGCTINRSKAAPSFFGRTSSKYLLLRVLRV